MYRLFRRIGLYVLRHLTLLPDKQYLQLRYLIEMRMFLKLKHPLIFQEKIQWLKLNNRKPEYTVMVDKYAVKQYVESVIGRDHVTPTLGVWDNVEEIDFDSLPKQFVLKTTHGGGNCGVVICKNKDSLDRNAAIDKLNNSLKSDIYKLYREWPYKDVRRRIIAEPYIGDGINDLADYKFFCFNGIPRYIQVIKDRNTCETIDFFDAEWNHQAFLGLNVNVNQAKSEIAKPANLKEMLHAAKLLSTDIPFVRIDFYQLPHDYRFGEITFFPASGYGTFTPVEWNRKLGDMLEL